MAHGNSHGKSHEKFHGKPQRFADDRRGGSMVVTAEPWRRMSLPSLLSAAAQGRADRLAFAETADTMRWLGRAPARLTHGTWRMRALHLAAQMDGFGIGRGDVVGLVLPNAVELPIALAACLALGAVPAPIGVHEPTDAIRGALEAADAVGVITKDMIGDLPLADRARQAAARAMNVRFLFGFGAALPEGIVGLDDWENEDLAPIAPLALVDSGDTAIVTFERRGKVIVPLARSHGQLVADAIALATHAGIDGNSRLLATLPAATAAGIVAGFVAPLVSGAESTLVPVFEPESFVAALNHGAPSHVLGPTALEEPLATHLRALGESAVRFLAVHRLEDGAGAPQAFDPARTTDLRALGESALLIAPRAIDSESGIVPLALDHPIGSLLPAGERYFEAVIDGYGRLAIGGFAAPRQFPIAQKAGAGLATGFMASAVPGGARLRLGAAGQDAAA